MFDRDPNGTDGLNAVRQASQAVDGIINSIFVLSRTNGRDSGGQTGNEGSSPLFIYTRNDGGGTQFQINKGTAPGLRRMNWREIPVVD